MTRRFVHGVGAGDDPLLQYDGAGLTSRRSLEADERGSIIRIANSNGATVATNRYDEYGVPAATNSGRFQYTGQAWLPELGLYYYKARMYSPGLGRFMQTDPIGYEGGINLYAYAANDPVNAIDPSGQNSYLVFRSKSGFSHAFVVVANKVGEPIQAQYSYSAAGPIYDRALIAVSGRHVTAVKDAVAWRSLANGPQQGVIAVRIQAADATVMAVGNAVNAALGSDPKNATLDYAPFPIPLLTASSFCNSNCPAFAIADEALAIEGKGLVPVPEGANPVGRSESDHVRSLIRGKIEGDIVVGRRCFGRTDCPND